MGQNLQKHLSENPISSIKRPFEKLNVEDFADLTQVQKHTCKITTCLRDGLIDGRCKAKFPKQQIVSTKVVYDIKKFENGETIITASVEPKRDSASLFTNNYSLLQLAAWRGNCDMRIIICEKSLYKYLMKYMTKAEVKSEALTDIMSTLIT